MQEIRGNWARNTLPHKIPSLRARYSLDVLAVSPWPEVDQDVVFERCYPEWPIDELNVVYFFSSLGQKLMNHRSDVHTVAHNGVANLYVARTYFSAPISEPSAACPN